MNKNLSDQGQTTLNDFLQSINPILAGYKHASFGYIATRNGDVFVLRQGQLHLLGVPVQTPSGAFESQNVKAGFFRLNESNQSLPQFLENLLSGVLSTPHGKLDFKSNDQKTYSIFFNPFQIDGIQSNVRRMQLVITGGQALFQNSTKLDWEVKAAEVPFENVQDVCNHFLAGSISGYEVRVEITAQNIAEI